MISPVKNRVFQCYRQATAVNTTVADQNTKASKIAGGSGGGGRIPRLHNDKEKQFLRNDRGEKKVQHIPPQMI